MKKGLLSLLCCCLIVGSLSVPALAVDSYNFSSENPDEFYQTGVTSVTYDGAIPGYVQEMYDFTPQTIYTSQWGATIIAPELDGSYGMDSQKPRNAPGSSASSGSSAITSASTNQTNYGVGDSSGAVLYPEVSTAPATNQYANTNVEDVRQANGSIGTLKIPAIGLTVTAYDGDVSAAMLKGVGHIDSTSAWNGNIGLSGHNRGVTYHFGKLKNLSLGDEITYTTSLGTRTYVVTAVQKIASNDWSWLRYTTDNRMTLITCVANQPAYRLVVQAVEKS